MCRAASRAAARPTTSRRSFAPTQAQGLHELLHHRRQFRAQQGLGGDPRSPDPSARGGGVKISFIIQVDTLCHKLPNFIDKCARAGVKRVFIGLENINPDNLLGAKKRQNKITEYRKMLLAWKAAGVITYAGYILGFPNDTHRIDPARYRRHQARAAGRPAGVLLSDAAAGLGGPPEAVQGRRRARSRHEQLRSQPCLHRASNDVARGMGEGLCAGLAALLHDEHIETLLRAGARHQDQRQQRRCS